MIYLPYYNITGKNKEYQYSYFLFALMRFFGLKHKVTKQDFIKLAISKGFKKTTVYRIWELGAFKNMFFRSIDGETLYLMGDKHFEYVIEKIPEYLYDNIKGINDFKLFLHTAFLGRSGYTNKQKQNTGIGSKKIAHIYNTTRQTIYNRNKRAVKYDLSTENRYYKTDDGFIVKATNKYNAPIRVIKNKFCKVKITTSKLIKEFVMPLFVQNAYTGDLIKKCLNRFGFFDYYDILNSNIFNGQIYHIRN